MKLLSYGHVHVIG
jgi:hypothetical protein